MTSPRVTLCSRARKSDLSWMQVATVGVRTRWVISILARLSSSFALLSPARHLGRALRQILDGLRGAAIGANAKGIGPSISRDRRRAAACPRYTLRWIKSRLRVQA